MNFKPNAWTLLFALALGAFLYQMNMKTETEVTPDPSVTKTSTCPPTRMPAADFYGDYANFLNYGEFLKTLFEKGATACPSMKKEFDSYASLVNPEVWSFKIPKCEMKEMLALNPDGEYYAYLVLKQPTADSSVIDLAFSHAYIPGDTGIAKMDQTLAAKGDGDGDEFFDFTTPCPPGCKGDGGD